VLLGAARVRGLVPAQMRGDATAGDRHALGGGRRDGRDAEGRDGAHDRRKPSEIPGPAIPDVLALIRRALLFHAE